MLGKKINIRVLNVTAIILTIVCVIVLVVLANMRLTVNRVDKPDTSIIRLHDTETGRFFCSGVVISPTRILTAAHCVARQSIFGMDIVRQVEIRGADANPTGIIAEVEGASPRQDLAILKGDFRGFDFRKIITNADTLNKLFTSPFSQIVMCGFPDGGPLRCSKLTNIRRWAFFFAGNGWLYPGMSGGPVFNSKGSVIAVNQAVLEDGSSVVSPLIELFNQLGLRESLN